MPHTSRSAPLPAPKRLSPMKTPPNLPEPRSNLPALVYMCYRYEWDDRDEPSDAEQHDGEARAADTGQQQHWRLRACRPCGVPTLPLSFLVPSSPRPLGFASPAPAFSTSVFSASYAFSASAFFAICLCHLPLPSVSDLWPIFCLCLCV